MSKITAVTPFALTAKGHALQLKVQAGICKLELVGVKIGDGCLEEGQTIESLTDLVHEIPTADGSEETQSPIAALGEVYRDKDSKGRERVMVHVYIRNGDNDSTRITECAILAKDTDGSTIIYGAINLGDSSMPFDKYNGTTPIVYNWKFPLYISNEANINMSFGFLAGVSREDFYNHVNNYDNPHKVTAEDVGAIPTTDKGAVNGVATLDENSVVPTVQLPMQYINWEVVLNKKSIPTYNMFFIISCTGTERSFYPGSMSSGLNSKGLVDRLNTTYGEAEFGQYHGGFTAQGGKTFELFIKMYSDNGVLKYDEYYSEDGYTTIPADVVKIADVECRLEGSSVKSSSFTYSEQIDEYITVVDAIERVSLTIRTLCATL